MKKVIGVHGSAAEHWVGDGFPVRSLFEYGSLGSRISPFLLLDHAGPAAFAPSDRRRGVGAHPHRGIETVSIVYEGAVAHRDSTGQGGVIGRGDVQWMTSGAGILHEEFHSDDFARRGGLLEMAQLWVNLPARHKMSAAGYQLLRAAEIPNVALPEGAGSLRVIAGEFAGRHGPAHTFSPIEVWDVRLKGGAGETLLTLPDGHFTAVVVLHGDVTVGRTHALHADETALLEPHGTALALQAQTDAVLLVLGGEPLDEPVVGQGPFVMNTQSEIRQAYADYHAGRFGRMPADAVAA